MTISDRRATRDHAPLHNPQLIPAATPQNEQANWARTARPTDLTRSPFQTAILQELRETPNPTGISSHGRAGDGSGNTASPHGCTGNDDRVDAKKGGNTG
jgi:hypothetical protein